MTRKHLIPALSLALTAACSDYQLHTQESDINTGGTDSGGVELPDDVQDFALQEMPLPFVGQDTPEDGSDTTGDEPDDISGLVGRSILRACATHDVDDCGNDDEVYARPYGETCAGTMASLLDKQDAQLDAQLETGTAEEFWDGDLAFDADIRCQVVNTSVNLPAIKCEAALGPLDAEGNPDFNNGVYCRVGLATQDDWVSTQGWTALTNVLMEGEWDTDMYVWMEDSSIDPLPVGVQPATHVNNHWWYNEDSSRYSGADLSALETALDDVNDATKDVMTIVGDPREESGGRTDGYFTYRP